MCDIINVENKYKSYENKDCEKQMKNNTPFLRYIAVGNHLPNKSFVKAYDCRFFYVLSGKGTFYTEKEAFELCPDTLCYYPSGCSYHIESDEKERLTFVSVNFDFTDSYRQDDGTLRPLPERDFDKNKERPSYKFVEEKFFAQPFSVKDAVFLRNDLLRLCEFSKSGGEYKKAVCSSLLKVIIIELSKYVVHHEKAGKPALLAMQYIERNFAAHLSVEIIAEKIGYHPYYLGAAFRKSTGVGVLEYINSVRIRSAEDLLLHTDEPISVIAERCGYESADRFSAVFKAQNKMPPSKWRHEHRFMY